MNRAQGEEIGLIAEQAAEWLGLLPTATMEEKERFLAWLQKSPLHVREFLAASIIASEVRKLDPERRVDVEELAARANNNVVSLPEHRRAHSRPLIAPSQAQAQGLAGLRRSGALSRRSRAIALTFPLVIILAVLVYVFIGISSDQIVTQAAEWRTVSLPDGSTAHAAPQSRLRIEFQDRQRTIYLIHGEASFKVAPNPDRPFVVNTTLGRVEALGTMFSVNRLSADEVIVAVTEGTVAVTITADSNKSSSAPPRRATLSAGQQLAIVCGSALPANQGADARAGTCGWLFLPKGAR